MRVDALAVQLRPRPMFEAADLGLRMVQAHARSVWRTWLPVYAAVVLLALATVEWDGSAPVLLLWWLKPWLDRSLLFVLSRAVFGQSTTFGDLWKARRQVWWGQWVGTLLWRRLSPWRAFTQPIYQLEGQTGTALRERRRILLKGQGGAASMMHIAMAHVELVLYAALIAMILWMLPADVDINPFRDLFDVQALWLEVLNYALYAAVVLLLEPFYVAAGLAMYLNRRVELEAWDIEQEFRRVFGA